MKVCCISDLHGNLPTIPDCDLLLIGGDICGPSHVGHQAAFLEGAFKSYVEEIIGGGTEIIAIGGNHDWLMQTHSSLWDEIRFTYGDSFSYLEDNSMLFEGLDIFGTPGSLPFYNWAFNYPEEKLEQVLENAVGADIIISHGPPKGVGDMVIRRRGVYKTLEERGKDVVENVGSHALLNAIDKIQPKLICTGHIHSQYGVYQRGSTKIISCSVVNEAYEMVNKPILVEI